MVENKKPEAINKPEEKPCDKTDSKKPLTVKESGGPAGPEPTRYGDWEVNGRCSDF